jgi:hypothetical protein
MTIKKLYYQFYESMGEVFTLEFKDTKLQYSLEGFRESRVEMINPIVEEDTDWDEVIVKLDSIPDDNIQFTPKQLKNFTDFIKTNCSDWKKKYELDGIVHDGTMWQVNIHIDDVKLKSKGQILFPDNFEEFTYQLSLLTGGKIVHN